MAHRRTWILVADASRARLFAARGHAAPWEIVGEFAHPQSSAKVRDIVTDRPGRVQQRTGTRRSAADPPTSPKEVEAQQFAQQLVSALDEGLERGSCEDVILIASPRFLGLVRQCASAKVRDAVTHSVNHDWTQVVAPELPTRLASELEQRGA